MKEISYRSLKFDMTDNNDTGSYARIFFSLASNSIGEKNIYHLCWSLCRNLVTCSQATGNIICDRACVEAPSFKFVSSVTPIRRNRRCQVAVL